MIKKAATYIGVAVVLLLAAVGAFSLISGRLTANDVAAPGLNSSQTDASLSETDTANEQAEVAPAGPGSEAAEAIDESGATKLATLIMSRTILGVPNAGRCAEYNADPALHPNSIPLLDIADHLTSIGVVATHSVVPGWTDATEPTCRNSASLVGSWETSAFLRDTHGWTAVSHGTNKVNLTELTTDAELHNETCGSIPLLEAEGHMGASSFFNFPGNNRSAEVEAIVSTCFEYGRRYTGPQANTFDEVRSGDLIKTYSVAGGTCPDCVRTHRQDYKQPIDIVNGVIGDPDQDTWGLVLFYKLVVGSKTEGHQQWDCTSPNPAEHWTNQGEVYCWDDFVWIIDQINAAGVSWVSPADVADGAVSGQS